MSKLNLLVAQGTGFNTQNNFDVSLAIQNFDTSSVPLSAVRVVSYAWLQETNIGTQFTSGVNSLGTFSQISSAVDPTNGLPQSGIVSINLTATSYRVFHNIVDSNKIAPQLTLNAPNGQSSNIAVVAYANNNPTYFDIILDDVVPVPGYTVSWFLPGNYNTYTSSVSLTSSPSISIQKIPEYIRAKGNKYDSQIIVSWPNSPALIPNGFALTGTDVYLQINPGLFPSSFITSAWYSSPNSTILSNNPYFILQQFNGSSWVNVQEYTDANTLDTLTGQLLTDSNFIKLVNSATGNNNSVYISVSGNNPISAGTFDSGELYIQSKGSGSDARRRSLIKFDTSVIPSSATSIKSAVLRLNTNNLTNAWNYPTTTGSVAVYQVSSSWVENQVTWGQRSSSANWVTSGGDYINSPALWIGNSNLSNSFTSSTSANQFWMDFDVTTIVDNWRQNPANNFGFLVSLFDSGNENNASNISIGFNSGRVSGFGPIAAYPELLISYNSLNTSGPTPSATITSPSASSVIFNPTFTIQASTSISGGSVESVSAYYRATNSVSPYQFLGSLFQTTLGNWQNTFTSLVPGSYDFIVRALSDLGNFGQSLVDTIVFSTSPAITVTSNSICHPGNITINGTIDITNGPPTSGSLSYVNSYIPNNQKITSLIEDRLNSGVVWVGTDGNGLYRVNRNTNSVTGFTTTNSNIAFQNITHLSMDSLGFIWIAYSGNGVGTFNSKNWATQTSNDWYLYTTANSSLSAYPINAIDITSFSIDSNDVKYFGLTWANINSVLSLSGATFTDQYVTKYNIGIYPRKVLASSGTIFVSTSDNRIFKYSAGSWTNYSLPTFQNINDFKIDSLGTVWVATDSGIATLSGSTFTELQSSATPIWPNGLNSGAGHLSNVQAKTIHITPTNTKVIGFSTANGVYNGGVVEYSGNNLTSVGSGWVVLDKSNYSGILSNNVNKIIVTSSDNYLWVGTDVGVSVISNSPGSYTWQNFSNSSINVPVTVAGNTWSANVTSPVYGNTGYNVSFNYPGNVVYTSSFNLNTEQQIGLSIVYPNTNLLTIQPNISKKILEYSVNNYLDVSNGDSVNVFVQKSGQPSGPWSSYYSYINSLDEQIFETQIPGTFNYVRVAASNNNCSATSSPFAVYATNQPVINLTPVSGNNFTNSIIKFFGNVSDLDFSNPIIVNGVSYKDSLTSVVFGYTSAGNFITVGNATLGTLTGSSASFEFDWSSPIAGVNQLSAIATTNYGTSAIASISFNTIVAVPSVTILSPIVNQIIPLNSPFILSASTQYITNPVSAVNFYIQSATNGLIGSGTSAGNIWTRSLTPSATLSAGLYNLYAIASDISGVSASANPVPFVVNTPPTLIQISPLSSTFSGSYPYQAQVNDVNGTYNNRVDILSGASILFSGYANGFGNFTWNWSNPASGTFTLSAKVYDGSPSLSSDYTVTPLNFNLNSASISLTSQTFPGASFQGSLISPKVNVITTSTNINLSANVIGSNISNVVFWRYKFDPVANAFVRDSVLSTDVTSPYNATVQLPSSRYYTSSTQSQYKFWGILAEATSTNGTVIDSNLLQFYVKEQGISASIQNSTCSNPIVFSGNFLDSDVAVNPSSAIIDNSVSAVIYDGTHNTYLGNLSSGGTRPNELVPFTYSYSNPSSSVSAVKFYVQDSYGIVSSAVINYGLINQVPYINLLSSTNYYSYSPLFQTFLISAGTISLSSTISGANIASVQYVVANSLGQTILSSVNNSASFYISASNDTTTIYSQITNSGNCVNYSTVYSYIVYQNVSANILPNNCASCYCNGTPLSISGNYTDFNYNNANLIGTFGYSVSAKLYDNFNNLIQDITPQLSNVGTSQPWIVSWSIPTVGATSVYLKVTNGTGATQTISQNLPRQISQAPTIVINSPVNGAIYSQTTPINFNVSTSGDDINAVKIYSNGNLLAVSQFNYNGNIYSWLGEKLPGIYSVSAVVLTNGGCVAVSSDTITISNGPVVNIITPVANSYYNAGTILSVTVDAKANLPANVSAVSVIASPGISQSATFQGGSIWSATLSALSNSISAYSISAIAYDTLGQSTTVSEKFFTGILPSISASISGTTSANTNFNQMFTVNVSGYSNTSGTLVASYLNISGTVVGLTSSSLNNFSGNILASQYLIPGQTNTIVAYVVDSNGAIASQNLYVYVNTFSGQTSYPVIEIISVNPPGKATYQILPSR